MKRLIKTCIAILLAVILTPYTVFAVTLTQEEYNNLISSLEQATKSLADKNQELAEMARQRDAALSAQAKVYEPKIKLQSPSSITVPGGRTVTQDIIIRNQGLGSASNVLTQADAGVNVPFTVSFLENSNSIRTISSGSSKTLKMEIRVDKEAASGTYPVTLKHTFFDDTNKSYTESDIFYIKIENDAAILNVIMYNFQANISTVNAGDSFSLSATIENVSSITAHDVSVTISGLEPTSIYLTNSVSNTYYKELSAQSLQNTEFKFTAYSKIASGSYPLTFTVKYRDAAGKTYENSYTYYVNVLGVEEEDPDKALLITGQITSPQENVDIGRNFNITIPVSNIGLADAKNVRIDAVASTDGAIVPKSASSQIIGNLAKDASTEVTFAFAATSTAKSQNYTIGFTISYETGADTKDGVKESISFMQFAGVNVFNPDADKDEEDEKAKKSVPRIIVSKFISEPTIVKAGQEFDLTLTFMNTHSENEIKNIKVQLTAVEETEKKGNVFTPVDASNTFYIDKIAPRGEVEQYIRMYTVPDASPKNYIINVNFTYEDKDNNEYVATELVGINVKQNTKFQAGDLNISQDASVGRPVNVYFDFYNTGKVTLSNLMIRLEGDFDTTNSSSYYSNFTPGYSDYYEGSFIPTEAGLKNGKVVVSYEDDSGEKIEETMEFSVNVAEPFVPDPSMMAGMEMQMNMEQGPQTFPQKILAYLKNPWVIGGIATGVVVIGLIIFFAARRARKQKRSLELDE